MEKIIKLTETHLNRIVKKVLMEQSTQNIDKNNCSAVIGYIYDAKNKNYKFSSDNFEQSEIKSDIMHYCNAVRFGKTPPQPSNEDSISKLQELIQQIPATERDGYIKASETIKVGFGQ